MFAAIHALRTASAENKSLRVLLLEEKERIGKKILVTGNGRCNLSNARVREADYFGDKKLMNAVLSQYGAEETLSFFHSLGLLTREDEAGRIYPQSNRASSVLDVLMYECDRLGVQISTGNKVTSLQRVQGGYLVNGALKADAVIIACGGCIDPACRQTPGVFPLLKALGVKITPPRPALTGIEITDFTKSLKGVRAEGKLTLQEGEKTCASASGEVQYTEYGLSGIPAMQLSSTAARLPENSSLTVFADSLPGVSISGLKAHFAGLRASSPQMPVQLFLSAFLPKPLGQYFMRLCGIGQDTTLIQLDNKRLNALLEAVKNCPYKVRGLRGFSFAQVTSGGVPGEELYENLMLKKYKNVFVCGETADVNGDCGGYNLQWAWSSGAVAGISAVREI